VNDGYRYDDETFFAPEGTTFRSMGIRNPILLERLARVAEGVENKDGMSFPPLVGDGPTAVQAASYQALNCYGGDDGTGVVNNVVIGAQTGSGKTLAYLLPLIDDVLERKKRLHALNIGIDNDVGSSEGSNEFFDDSSGEYIGGGGLGYEYARAIILVPNRELADQVMRMAQPLCRNTIASSGDDDDNNIDNNIDIDIDNDNDNDNNNNINNDNDNDHEIVNVVRLPGGLKSYLDFRPFRRDSIDPTDTDEKRADIVVATPAALAALGPSPRNGALFADVRTLVMDEADMLLDGGYRRNLEDVLMGFRRTDKVMRRNGAGTGTGGEQFLLHDDNTPVITRMTQHVLVAATLPSMGLRSVESYISKRFPNALKIMGKGMHDARHYGLGRTETLWIGDQEDNDAGSDSNRDDANRKRMNRLVKMLLKNDDGQDNAATENHDRTTATATNGILHGEKVMIFLNTVDDAEGASAALQRTGVNAVPYHAKLPSGERRANLERFRRFRAHTEVMHYNDDDEEDGPVPILVCTDLASRGLDVPGVTAVVQLQFATDVVSHLHRMGRCGRAGRRDGRGVIFYNDANDHANDAVGGDTRDDIITDNGGGGGDRQLAMVVRDAECHAGLGLGVDVDVDVTIDENVNTDGDSSNGGKVEGAFSRKRGFSKKLKKKRRERVGNDNRGGNHSSGSGGNGGKKRNDDSGRYK